MAGEALAPQDTMGSPMRIPSAYRSGYEKARALNPELATMYVEHTAFGDPEADEVIEALASFDQREVHRYIQAGMEQDAKALAGAPLPLREFFERIETPPPWFDPDSVHAGCRAFHAYSDLFIPAFFVVTLQNAATLISKAFYLTGRVKTRHGLRRIRQNTRHFIEIMLPGALSREGEGWKLSVRIRLVHAQVRRLLRASGSWDETELGAPLNAAHLALSSANFSATMLRQAERLGARLDAESRASFMQTWRYASHLIGSPEPLLFEGDESKTTELHRIATACEPPPNDESAVIANALVNAVPQVAGVVDPDAQRKMALHVYRVSRALLGNETADRLDFPRQQTAGLLAWMRWKRGLWRAARRAAPHATRNWHGNNFVFLLDASMIPDLSYRLPDRLEAEKASPW